MSKYKPTEYIVDFGDYRSNAFVKLSMALIEQNGAKLHERVVRCCDCTHKRRAWNGHEPNFIGNWFCSYTGGHEVKPDDFCSRGERKARA